MQPVPHVVIQVSLLLAAVGTVVVCAGDSVAPGVAVVIGVGAAVAALFVAGYHVRRRARCARSEISIMRLRDDRRMAVLLTMGYGIPLAVSGAMLAGVHVTGVEFHSETATVASCLPVAALAAVLTSTAVDWYLITPFQRGVINPPICRQAADVLELTTRRAYAKWWVLQRAMTETIAYTCAGLLLVLIGGVLIDQFKAASPLQFALGSFIGAATAVWLAAYVNRLVQAWQFLQEQSVGLGQWVEGVDARDARIEGFVRDVSITPGIQICSTPAGQRLSR
jgi:hypothetical protein